MTSEITRHSTAVRSHELTGVQTGLRTLGLELPPKHAKAIDEALTLRSRIAQHAPEPTDVIAAMEKALKAGTDPLDTDEAKRFATAQILLLPDIIQPTQQRATDALHTAVTTAVPDIIESMRPIASKAGEDIAAASDLLGDAWLQAPSSQYAGKSLAVWATAREALTTLRKVAGVWGSIINLISVRAHPTDRWLIFCEPEREHLAYGTDRLDALWPVRLGLEVQMADLDTLRERQAKATELTASAQRAQERADTDARSDHMNKVR